MRESVAAIAIIRRQQEGRTLYLAQWNPGWQRFHFVGGHRQADESFRQCVAREVGEELGIAPESEFLVGEQPLAHVDYTAWSDRAGRETHYEMELFEVQLAGEAARQRVDADPLNRWLTEDEIREHCCRDGQPVSETMSLLLRKACLV
jgi:8-oxo-dGTP pyrophosphatase MutT (NUDIX family)